MANNTSKITSAIVPAPNEILNNLLSTLKAGLILAGVENPVLDTNSQFYITATALANQLNIGFQQLLVMLGALMPDTATGADLDRLANFYGIYRRAATSSDLIVTVSFTSNTYVPAGAQLVSNNGLIYQVLTGTLLTQGLPGLVISTGTVEIISIDTGSQTALAIGDVLSWIDQPAFVQSTVTVADVAGEGIDIENDSALRTRLLNTLQNPPQYGNWSQVASTAENASPLIEKAYVYPAANGPSTQYVVLTQAQTPSNITNRAVTFNSLPWIQAYSAVKNQAPAFVETVIPYYLDGYGDGYSLQNITNDLSFQMDLPYPVGSQNGVGIGGGWVNFAPFPNAGLQPSGGYFAYVKTIINPNKIVVTAAAPGGSPDTALINRITNISWITDQTSNNNGWRVDSAQVTVGTAGTVTGGLCDYTLTINAPFYGAVGDYIFPSMVNAQSYVDSILLSFAGLGPGEINTIQSLYPNSYRQPLISISNPNVVDARFLKELIVNNSEVIDAAFYYNQTGSPQVSQSINGTPPTIPNPIPSEGGTTSVGIYVPSLGRIGFYV